MNPGRVIRVALCLNLLAGVALAGGAPQAQTYKGLEITPTSLDRATRVSLQDCPPGSNTQRGVIRPNEDSEFATVGVDFEVLPSFEPTALEKPLLYDEAGNEYRTAQSFGELNAEGAYSCSFSFRVPKGAKLTRFVIEEASFDVGSFEN